MALYNQWDKAVQVTFDEEKVMALGVLRRLLSGGLVTEERDARHRKHTTAPRCVCVCVWQICDSVEARKAENHICDLRPVRLTCGPLVGPKPQRP